MRRMTIKDQGTRQLQRYFWWNGIAHQAKNVRLVYAVHQVGKS
jgi:hypothetical protein